MIRLTYEEWQTVQEQCSACKHWDNGEGCQFPKAVDNLPAEDCGVFERKAEEGEA